MMKQVVLKHLISMRVEPGLLRAAAVPVSSGMSAVCRELFALLASMGVYSNESAGGTGGKNKIFSQENWEE